MIHLPANENPFVKHTADIPAQVNKLTQASNLTDHSLNGRLAVLLKQALVGPTNRAHPIRRKIVKRSTWSYTIIGITLLGVIHIATNTAGVFVHETISLGLILIRLNQQLR